MDLSRRFRLRKRLMFQYVRWNCWAALRMMVFSFIHVDVTQNAVTASENLWKHAMTAIPSTEMDAAPAACK